MELDKKFKFEFEKQKSCYTVYKFFGNRNGIDRFLPVAEIKTTDNSPSITFLTQANLTEDEKNFISKKASSL